MMGAVVTTVDERPSVGTTSIKWGVVVLYFALQLGLPVVVGMERARLLAVSGLLILGAIALVLRWRLPHNFIARGIFKGVLACVAVTVGLLLVGVFAVIGLPA